MQKNKFNIWDKVFVIDRSHYTVVPAMIVKTMRSEWAEYQNQWAKKIEEMKRGEQYAIDYELRVETLWGMAKWIFREEDLYLSLENWLEYLAKHTQEIIDLNNKNKTANAK